MKKIFKLFNAYQTITDRIDHYASFKHIVISTLLSMITVSFPMLLSIFLISKIWTYSYLVYILSAILIVVFVYLYFLIYYLILRKLVPKIKEVKVSIAFWFESSIAIFILLTVVLIFIAQLRK